MPSQLHNTLQRRAEDLNNNWHLDKRIPLALIITAILQIGTFVWWAAKTDSNVSSIGDRVKLLEGQELKRNDLIGRVISVEVQVSGINDSLKRIERNMDMLVDMRQKERK